MCNEEKGWWRLKIKLAGYEKFNATVKCETNNLKLTARKGQNPGMRRSRRDLVWNQKCE